VNDKDEILFQDLPESFDVCHYHSWSVVAATITKDLKVTAVDNEGMIMGIRHVGYDVRGLQFHPESIMTPEGPKMIENWLKH
jgi:anthranilate synthase component 2